MSFNSQFISTGIDSSGHSSSLYQNPSALRFQKWKGFSFPVIFFFLLVFFTAKGFPETIDRIAAVVNEEVITLSDIRIAEAFGLYEDVKREGQENLLFGILERLIDQKLVIQLTSETISIENEELDAYILEITEGIGSNELKIRMSRFDMDLEDLKEYLHDKILYQKIISSRFSQLISVRLSEIESYYNQIYIPSQEKKGIEAEPMMEILGEIESAIKNEKMNRQVEKWMQNLRREAVIQILLKESETKISRSFL